MRAFTKGQFVSEIRSILNMAGLPQHHYAGHSFRIGAATSAALAGVGDSTIQALGRWYSAVYMHAQGATGLALLSVSILRYTTSRDLILLLSINQLINQFYHGNTQY